MRDVEAVRQEATLLKEQMHTVKEDIKKVRMLYYQLLLMGTAVINALSLIVCCSLRWSGTQLIPCRGWWNWILSRLGW